jgi:nitroreductase
MNNHPVDSNRTKEGTPAALATLRALLMRVPCLLAEIADETAARAESGKWSKKEELGHLLDSALNNHRRIVLVGIADTGDTPALPDYDGEAWVSVHQYGRRGWQELIEAWQVLNKQLLAAAGALPQAAWARTCTIGDSGPMTLAFIVDDYVSHITSHLKHIGVELDETSLETTGSDEDLYPDRPAHATFPVIQYLGRRWSPRAFAEGRPVERAKILTMIEAARWAPSCFNEQPWRYLVFDGSDPDALERARGCLVEGNAWALKAPVLMISVAHEVFAKTGQPNRTAEHDVGLASENLVVQAVALGLAAHQMAGFDLDRARSEFAIPDAFTPMAMIAVGYPYRGKLDDLPENLKARELQPRARKSLGEIAFNGNWEVAY